MDRSRPLVLPEAIGWGRRGHPERSAMIFGTERRTHAELDDRAGRLAGVLGAHGVRAGDRVALLLHNGFEFVESMVACHKLGACAVPVNFRLTLEEMRFILEDAGVAGLIAGEELARLGASLAAQVAGIRIHIGVGAPPGGPLAYHDVVSAASPLREPATLREDDLALLCYTSARLAGPREPCSATAVWWRAP